MFQLIKGWLCYDQTGLIIVCLKKPSTKVVLSSVVASLDLCILTRKNLKCDRLLQIFNNADVYVPLTEMPLTESNLLYLYFCSLLC